MTTSVKGQAIATVVVNPVAKAQLEGFLSGLDWDTVQTKDPSIVSIHTGVDPELANNLDLALSFFKEETGQEAYRQGSLQDPHATWLQGHSG